MKYLFFKPRKKNVDAYTSKKTIYIEIYFNTLKNTAYLYIYSSIHMSHIFIEIVKTLTVLKGNFHHYRHYRQLMETTYPISVYYVLSLRHVMGFLAAPKYRVSHIGIKFIFVVTNHIINLQYCIIC